MLGEGAVHKDHSWRFMDPMKFRNALGDFPVSVPGGSAEELASVWNLGAHTAFDRIVRESSIPDNGGKGTPWITEDLRSIKH